MTISWRSWLPANAVLPASAQGALADMVDGWSREWVAEEPLRALGTLARVADPRAEIRKTAWHLCEGGLAIGLPPAGAAALGVRVLGLAAAGVERPRADLDLLDRVGGDCLADLKRRAAALFGLDRGAAWRETDGSAQAGPVHRIEIGSPALRPVLILQLSAELFARFVRAKLASPPAPAMLGTPAAAFATLPVSLSAMPGRCALTVAELSGLAEGDVLVLDRALDAPLPLAIGGVPARRGACTLYERKDGIALQITEAPAG